MKFKYRRFIFIIISLSVMGLGIALFLKTLRKEVVFFITPSAIVKPLIWNKDSKLRLGGYVNPHSVYQNGLKVKFQVTDFEENIWIFYEGVLPTLFRDGQGVIVEGNFTSSGLFRANLVMAKHDQNYKPPEIKNIKERN